MVVVRVKKYTTIQSLFLLKIQDKKMKHISALNKKINKTI